ncbi:Long-chain-fatty-acid--CoA ligase [Nymphon striatum]|nr:Long-chain-fatty-acid--CoA ligase [Nymphon striatum]
MLTHRNLMANAVHTQLVQPLLVDDRYLTIAPMFHAAGVYSLLALIWVGASNIVLPAFSPDGSLDVIEAENITSLIAVPSMLAAMVESQASSPRDVVRALRWISHGASPVALEVLKPGEELWHRSSGVEIRDKAGAVLPQGEAGEVTVQGPNVMLGYWNKPEQTADALDEHGWYSTGDVGFLDTDGYLYLVDRSKDMIVSGGENVYCSEVEDALYNHTGVLEATVFGIPDDKWGEAVHAVVVPRPGAELTEQIIIDHCRGQIGGYKGQAKSSSANSEPRLGWQGPPNQLDGKRWRGAVGELNLKGIERHADQDIEAQCVDEVGYTFFAVNRNRCRVRCVVDRSITMQRRAKSPCSLVAFVLEDRRLAPFDRLDHRFGQSGFSRHWFVREPFKLGLPQLAGHQNGQLDVAAVDR